MPWKPIQDTLAFKAQLQLQFGHGGDAVETEILADIEASILSRFNSATAVMPWKRPR